MALEWFLLVPLLLILTTPAVFVNADEPCQRSPGPQSTVQKLKDQLLRNYDVEQRPPTEGGAPVAITHAMVIMHIEGIYYNTAYMDAMIGLTWTDSRLVWNKEQLPDMSMIMIDSSTIWTPTVGVYSHLANGLSVLDLVSQPCLLRSRGMVTCVITEQIDAHCASDYRVWPRDVHNCTFHMSSAMHASNEVFLDKLAVYTDTGYEASWIAMEHGGTMSNSSVGADGREHSMSVMWIMVAHQEAVMAVCVYGDAFATSVLTVSPLALPASCGERLVLAAVSLLETCSVLVYLGWWLESGADAPRIVLFHRDVLWAAGWTLVVVVLASRLKASRRAAPAWLSAALARLRATPVGGLLLPPPPTQPAADVAPVAISSPGPEADGDAEPPGDGEAAGGGALFTSASVTAPNAAGSDSEWWCAASVLVERLGSAGIIVALVASLVRLLV